MLTLPTNITCGFCDCSEFGNLSVSPVRSVTQFEIEFYLQDAKTTFTDMQSYEIKKNFVQIAKPGQVRHSLLPFNTAYVKFSVEGEIARRLYEAPEYFCSSHPKLIYNKISEMTLLNEQGNSLLLHSQLLSFLHVVLSDAKIPVYRSGKNYEIISTAKKYIETEFKSPLKLKDIANHVHLSEIYFHNIFTQSTGISPHKYLIDCRIENAKKLLWNSEIPISDVAEKSGFGCQQYLNKVFKKETGMTPVSYRKSCQENYLS